MYSFEPNANIRMYSTKQIHICSVLYSSEPNANVRMYSTEQIHIFSVLYIQTLAFGLDLKDRTYWGL